MRDRVEQLADLVLLLERVPQRELGIQDVVVSPAMALAGEVTGLHELRDDSLRGPLGDAHGRRDVADPRVRISRDLDEDVRVIREERPL